MKTMKGKPIKGSERKREIENRGRLRGGYEER